ncbi:hypothetical protein BAE44_0024407 [Dichanthelium oligosanthes]|uniref:Uncharacterized protein n=1 Tax=Dichanthelium oligosanthes TaxID=888268 RepID=A0A1E5UNY2_9POAL|nr:hypothetical protein BAE44_0024407 [Dichanthelium oligosanthes]
MAYMENLRLMETCEIELPLAHVAFTLGENLLEDATELQQLLTKMRQLHNWYKVQAKIPNVAFGVRIPKDTFHETSGAKLWVTWECLFQLFHKHDLDVQLELVDYYGGPSLQTPKKDSHSFLGSYDSQ